MKNLVTINTGCTKCLASIHVALINQGIDLSLLEEFVSDSLVCQDQKFSRIYETSDYQSILKERQKLVAGQLLLSLIKRSKAFS